MKEAIKKPIDRYRDDVIFHYLTNVIRYAIAHVKYTSSDISDAVNLAEALAKDDIAHYWK